MKFDFCIFLSKKESENSIIKERTLPIIIVDKIPNRRLDLTSPLSNLLSRNINTRAIIRNVKKYVAVNSFLIFIEVELLLFVLYH